LFKEKGSAIYNQQSLKKYVYTYFHILAKIDSKIEKVKAVSFKVKAAARSILECLKISEEIRKSIL